MSLRGSVAFAESGDGFGPARVPIVRAGRSGAEDYTSRSMRRPNYGTVTGVTAALTAVCFLRAVLLPYIPPPSPEIAQWGNGEFVRRAADQEVRWRPVGKAAFDEARRLSRPLVVVVGVPWSRTGREADDAFVQPDVARALNRGFVPVRIDAAQDPRWLSQFLPLERARSGFGTGFQAWVFDLRYRLVDYVAPIDGREGIDENTLLDALLAAKRRFAEAALSDATPAFQANQDMDRFRLLQPTMATLDLVQAAPDLAAGVDRDWGGWDRRGLFMGRPLAWRFLQLADRRDEVGDALRRIALSPRADWLDGGFYRAASKATGVAQYDKPAVLNAQTAEVLAVQDALRPDPLLRRAARGTVDWLLAMCADDLVPAAQVGDEDARGRSARASFSPVHLRDSAAWCALPSSVQAWAGRELGLGGPGRVLSPSPEALGDPRFETARRALLATAGPRRKVVGEGLCDVNGTVAASLLRCARLWNDRALAASGGALVDRLESFRTPEGFRHALTDSEDALPYLGDALAYADAAMEDYLTNGRAPSLDAGVAALRGALRTFGGIEPGLLRPSPPGTALLPGVDEVPQVTDDEREALSALALRLLDAYAVVLGKKGADLAVAARNVASRLRSATDPNPSMGGALGALARHGDPAALFVVGPDATARARRLAPKLPNRLVVPVLGNARSDLRLRAPGLYVLETIGPVGPLSEAEALSRLGSALDVAL